MKKRIILSIFLISFFLFSGCINVNITGEDSEQQATTSNTTDSTAESSDATTDPTSTGSSESTTPFNFPFSGTSDTQTPSSTADGDSTTTLVQPQLLPQRTLLLQQHLLLQILLQLPQQQAPPLPRQLQMNLKQFLPEHLFCFSEAL